MQRGLAVASGRFGAAAGRQGAAAAREAVFPAAMRAGALAQGGQRRWMAEAGKQEEKKEDEKEDDKKKTPPKAGPGFFQTFVNSVREQMGAAAESDPKFKESQEQIEVGRQRALVAAEAAMKRAKIVRTPPSSSSSATTIRMMRPNHFQHHVSQTWAPSPHAAPRSL
jgi:hypothetical protein